MTVFVACVVAASILLMPVVHAEPLSEETGEAILQELKGIRGSLERIEKSGDLRAQRTQPAAPQVASVSIKDRPFEGREDAPLTLVEFTDYQCPYCQRFVHNTYPQVKEMYIDTGKLRLVVKDLPLAMHPNARKAAQAAHCAREQEAFWPMHYKLFENSRRLGEELLPEYAAAIGLDETDFEKCLSSNRHLADIDADSREARQVGITGTPAFILGKSDGDTVKGVKINGAQPFANFQSRIDGLLAKQGE